MLLASNYFLLGDFFSRRISIDESGARSVFLHRVNNFLYYWYSSQIDKSFEEIKLLRISKTKSEIVSENILKLSEYYQSSVEYYDFDFHRVQKFSKSENTSIKISLEKDFINSKYFKKLSKIGLNRDVLLDSFSTFPVIPEDKEAENINYEIFKRIYPKIKPNAEIVILSGELVWSGWLTMDIILNTLDDNKFNNKIFVIDSWGLVQQLLSTTDSDIDFKIVDYDDLIDSFTTSILLSKKSPKTLNQIAKMKSNNYPLYANSEMIETFPSGVTHKPDYTFVLGKSPKSLLSKTVINTGIDKVTPLTIPKSILQKVELTYLLPVGSVLQKYEGERVTLNEDIGLLPEYENHLLRIKLPKQLTMKVNNGQYIKRGDVIAKRAVMKNMLKEKVVSPFTGYLNKNFLEQGILIFKELKDKRQFLSDFEGEFLNIDKSEIGQFAKIRANSFTTEINYKIGPDVQGVLMRITDIQDSNESKILLVKPNELGDITLEFLMKNNIMGLIVDKPDYQVIRKYISRVLKDSKATTICLLNPFSIISNSDIIDILYLYTGNSVVISDNSLHLLIDQRQSKEILLRLKSRDTQAKKSVLRKGEHISFFNYSHQDPYARIENVSPHELVLNTERDILVSNFSNIIKYTNTFYDSESK